MLKSSLYFAYQFELKTHDICFFASPLSCQCCIPLGSYSCNMKTSTLNRGNVSHRKRAKMHITGWSNDHAVILSQACFFFKKKILVRSCVLYKSRKQQCGLGVYAPQMHKSPAFSFINNFFNWQILILQRCYQNKILTCSSKYAANFKSSCISPGYHISAWFGGYTVKQVCWLQSVPF